MGEPWRCPRCGNFYRQAKDCSECATSTLHQGGNGNQGNVILGSNHAPITQQITSAQVPIEASYQLRPRRKFASAGHVTYLSEAAGITGGVFVLAFVADATSVLDRLIGAPPQGLTEIALVVGLALFAIWVSVSKRNRNIGSPGRTFFRADVYEAAQDGSVTVHTVRAKCPVPHCDGHLNLVSAPPPNRQGIERPIGICDVHGLYHAFEFNLGSLKGNRVEVHLREESKTS